MSKRWKDVSEDFRTKAEKFWEGLLTWQHYDRVMQWKFEGYLEPTVSKINPEADKITVQIPILPEVHKDNETAVIIFDLEGEKFKVEVGDLMFNYESQEPDDVVNELDKYTTKLVKKVNYKGGSPIFERIAMNGINP